jgi:Tol biopolymer transport system component
MNISIKVLLYVVLVAASCTMVHCDLSGEKPGGDVALVEQLPAIDPDYSGIVIPPNIAPLNFKIKEAGEKYVVRLHSTNGEPLEISSKSDKIIFPINSWKKLLRANAGNSLIMDVRILKKGGEWQRFLPVTNDIAKEDIDSHLAYRLFNSAFKYWNKMGIYQRDLESFEEKPIMLNRLTGGNCMNCHNFCSNDPSKMIFHLRGGAAGGMILADEGRLVKVNLATEFNKPGAYPSWHPSGKLITFSVNKLTMFYHATEECRDVLDRASDLIVYKIKENMITTSPSISRPDRMETFPNWSHDGRYLYFCSSPELQNYVYQKEHGEDLAYDKILYDLNRVAYDVDTDTWGELETVISAAEFGKSVVLPRASPDGRYILFTAANYGSFPIYHEHADLYMLDLKDGSRRWLDINSDRTESFHSWSSNSRWFVFSSKRRDGFFSRPFFSHVDQTGNVSKPFIMPQKDPEYYNSLLLTYNVPELIKGAVKIRPQAMAKVAVNPQKLVQATLDPKVKLRDQHETEESIYQARPTVQ